jgi:preprotein translocase subunit SecE
VTETAEATPERPASDAGRNRLSRLFGRLGLYYRQVVAELRKVIWPTRKELITYTAVVMVFVTIMISYVSALDFGFSKLILKIFG